MTVNKIYDEVIFCNILNYVIKDKASVGYEHLYL
jgi:hypothetical protein